jgi:hypothetical protein
MLQSFFLSVVVSEGLLADWMWHGITDKLLMRLECTKRISKISMRDEYDFDFIAFDNIKSEDS